MEVLRTTLWLATVSFEVLLVMIPVLVPVAIWFVVMLLAKNPYAHDPVPRGAFLVWAQMAGWFLMVLVGGLGNYQSGIGIPEWLGLGMTWAIALAQVAFAVWITWSSEGFRWFMASASTLQACFSVAAWFVAGMSITDNWL